MTDYTIIVKFRPCASCASVDPSAFKLTDVPGSLLYQTERLCMACQGAPRATHRCSGCDVPLQRSRTITLGENEWTLCKKCLGVMREMTDQRALDFGVGVDHLLDLRGRWMRDNRRCGAAKRSEWLDRFDGLERICVVVDEAEGWHAVSMQVT